jgi:predicted PurR-regulated permease PerM
MVDTLQRIWQNIYLRVILLLALAYLLYIILRVTRIAWVTFLIAFLIAYLVEPFVDRLERNRLVPRWLSVTLTILLIFLFFVVGVILVGDILAQLATLPSIIGPFVNALPARLEAITPPWAISLLGGESVQTFVEEQRSAIIAWFQGRARQLVRGLGTFIGGVGQALVIVVLAGFMISSYSVIQESIYRLFPARFQPFARDLAAKLDKSVGGYVRAQVIRSIIVALVLWVTLLIVGVPKAAAIALISAVLNPIPYLGPSLASIPAVLSALTESWQQALIVLILCIIIQGLDGNVLQPLVLAQAVQVHPVTVLVALLAGGALFGFWGILLAIPISAFIQLLYNDYYLTSDWYRGLTHKQSIEPHEEAAD